MPEYYGDAMTCETPGDSHHDEPSHWLSDRCVADDHASCGVIGALLTCECACHADTWGADMCANGSEIRNEIPGWEGSLGPWPSQYAKPHVYARDIQSGAGNCVCGRSVGESVHVQAAPGVPVPDRMRP